MKLPGPASIRTAATAAAAMITGHRLSCTKVRSDGSPPTHYDGQQTASTHSSHVLQPCEPPQILSFLEEKLVFVARRPWGVNTNSLWLLPPTPKGMCQKFLPCGYSLPRCCSYGRFSPWKA
jgi:hypothetical protein